MRRPSRPHKPTYWLDSPKVKRVLAFCAAFGVVTALLTNLETVGGVVKRIQDWVFPPPVIFTFTLPRVYHSFNPPNDVNIHSFVCFRPLIEIQDSKKDTLLINHVVLWASRTKAEAVLNDHLDMQFALDWKLIGWTGTMIDQQNIIDQCGSQKNQKIVGAKLIDPAPFEVSDGKLGPGLRFTLEQPSGSNSPFKARKASLLQVCMWAIKEIPPEFHQDKPPELGSSECPHGERFSVLAQDRYTFIEGLNVEFRRVWSLK
jgi:hypothetical protein